MASRCARAGSDWLLGENLSKAQLPRAGERCHSWGCSRAAGMWTVDTGLSSAISEGFSSLNGSMVLIDLRIHILLC